MREVELERPPLVADRLGAALAGTGAHVEILTSCPSTNTVLAGRVATGGAGDLQVLVAEHQVAGLGRLGRTFVTPDRAALTFSVALAPVATPPACWGWIPLMMGLAAVRAVPEVTGLEVALKWPNDVLVMAGERPGKLAGILATVDGGAVVVGMGLNVSQTAAELPAAMATSVALAGVAAPDRTRLLAAVLTSFTGLVSRWRTAGGDAAASGVAAEVAAAMSTLGRRVRVERPGRGELHGLAEGLGPGGELVVRTAAGQRLTVSAGDVHHLRDD